MPSLVKGQRREGQIRTRIGKGGTLNIEQDFFFRIRADTLEQDRFTILHTTPGTPTFGTIYGSYGMVLKGANADRMDDDPYLWNAVYHLSNEVVEGENVNQSTGLQQSGSPTDWLAVFDLGFEDDDEVFRESLDFDTDATIPNLVHLPGGTDADGYSGKKWVTSAGEPYQTGFVRQSRIITRDFVQFEKIVGAGALTLDDIEARNDVINSGEFLGKPKRTLKLTVESCSAGFYYGIRCWKVGYRLHYRKRDWRLKQLDVGTYYVEGGQKKPFLDDEGNRIHGSLDGNGGKAADQLDPAIRYHKEFEEVDLSTIVRNA